MFFVIPTKEGSQRATGGRFSPNKESFSVMLILRASVQAVEASQRITVEDFLQNLPTN